MRRGSALAGRPALRLPSDPYASRRDQTHAQNSETLCGASGLSALVVQERFDRFPKAPPECGAFAFWGTSLRHNNEVSPMVPAAVAVPAIPGGVAARRPARRPCLSAPVVAVIGATGAVGVEMVECLAKRRNSRCVAAPVRIGALGRAARGFNGRSDRHRRAARGCARRYRHRAVLRGQLDLEALRPVSRRSAARSSSTTPRRFAWSRTCLWSCRRSMPMRSRPSRHHRQSELRSDLEHHAALADPPGQSDPAADHLDLSGRLRRRRRGDE